MLSDQPTAIKCVNMQNVSGNQTDSYLLQFDLCYSTGTRTACTFKVDVNAED